MQQPLLRQTNKKSSIIEPRHGSDRGGNFTAVSPDIGMRMPYGADTEKTFSPPWKKPRHIWRLDVKVFKPSDKEKFHLAAFKIFVLKH
jgi:hypothetical protein